MTPRTRTVLWSLLGLAVLLGVLWEYYPLQDARTRLDALPLRGSGYAGNDLPLTEAEQGAFEGTRVIKRLYQYGAHQFVLIVIDGSHNRHVVHDPTYCFRGAGWRIAKQASLPLEGGNGKLLRLTRKDEENDVLYWFSDGFERHGSVSRYWVQTTLRRLTLGVSAEEPVLVILRPVEGNAINWRKLVDQFGPIYML